MAFLACRPAVASSWHVARILGCPKSLVYRGNLFWGIRPGRIFNTNDLALMGRRPPLNAKIALTEISMRTEFVWADPISMQFMHEQRRI
jgi:hypothetical protein